MKLTGLHHITAVTRQAAANVEFYTQALGMRLVKKTVNQDDVSAYHLFYGDAAGNAGTEMTFFDWSHSTSNRSGSGAISSTAFRVADTDALAWWAARFDTLGVSHSEIAEVAGRATLRFQDPEGQVLSLVSDGGAPGGTPWDKSTVPATHSIKGLDGVTLTVREIGPTASVLTQVLGFERTRDYANAEGQPVVVFETGAGGPGTEIHVAAHPNLPSVRPGAGGVHHVAFRTPNGEEQQAWHEKIVRAGLHASGLIDRFYFQSVYFREPGGILFEIATDGPGFATDEDAAHLGERLSLPPFLEPRRVQIEAGLRPL